jgi:ABC-2 type transport system ATP-binding protein
MKEIAVSLSNISRSFQGTKVLDNLSFSVKKGEIFGLLGPNGAGKTTTIRVMLDIIKAGSGEVNILGGPFSAGKKDQIGYIPEERGLYQDISLERCVHYMGMLKGIPAAEVKKRTRELLEQFDLLTHRKKKLKQLSKGMQQKAQIITAVIHQPQLLIVDEPFAALDPVNTKMVKEMMLSFKNNGTTIIMSTHQMHQVEELCDSIILINRGKVLVEGPLADVRRRYPGAGIRLRVAGGLPELEGVELVSTRGGIHKLKLAEGTTPKDVFKMLASKDVVVEKFEQTTPSLDEIFIMEVQKPGQ